MMFAISGEIDRRHAAPSEDAAQLVALGERRLQVGGDFGWHGAEYTGSAAGSYGTSSTFPVVLRDSRRRCASAA